MVMRKKKFSFWDGHLVSNSESEEREIATEIGKETGTETETGTGTEIETETERKGFTQRGWSWSTVCLTCLIHMCVTGSFICVWSDPFICVWRDSFKCVWRGSFVCVWRGSFICVWCGSFVCVWRRAFVCVWHVLTVHQGRTRYVTHSHVWHDSFLCVTWLIHICDMTHSHVRHDSFTCVRIHLWMRHASVYMYGVALVSSIN